MKNIFINAKFGDKFKRRDGEIAIYHGYNNGYHWVIFDNIQTGCGSNYFYKENGVFRADGKESDYDIIGKYVGSSDNDKIIEAIQHCYDIAAKHNCTGCADDHIQLAHWLEELLEYRQTIL